MGNCWKKTCTTSENISLQSYPHRQNLNRDESIKYINDIKSYNTDIDSLTYKYTYTDDYKDILNTMGNTVKPIIERAEKTGTCNISGKKLDQIPESIFAIGERLRTLDASKNNIQRIPPAISAFQMIKHLNLSSNYLVTLPNEIKYLIKLEVLNISFNIISSLPRTLSQLISLRDFNASNNEIRIFPDQLAGIKKLDSIDVSNNRITEIIASIKEINAVEINLNNNAIMEMCIEISQMPRLKVLRLDENCFKLEVLRNSGLLTDSGVNLLTLENCPFDSKELHQTPGYDKYMERYTASKKKIQ